MKRKILALCVVVAMLTVAIVSSTMAYFTDTDQAVNVMTMGNVDIKQLEYTRIDPTAKPDDANLTEFEDDFEVVPAVYDTIAWEDEGADDKVFANSMGNVYDKFIRVENTGKSAAYVRTFLAFEDTNGIADKLHISYTDNAKFAPVKDTATGDVLHITVDGVEYEVYCYTYPDPVEPNGVTEFSLKQFFFNKTTTNEDVKGIDEYKILALSQAIQAAGFTPDVNQLSADITAAATNALNEGFGDPAAPSSEDVSITNVAAWFGGVYADYQATLVDTWDGTVDITWYNDTDTEFTLATAEQLAGLAELVDDGNTFEGKTIKLDGNIDLEAYVNDERVSFNPIGYGYNTVFKGTFDGQGHTISNLYQNGWALGLDYSTEGGGLFASVVDATIKNLTIDSAEIVMECIDMGTLVGYSYGNCTYENISIKNSTIANYNRYTGGVVGEVNGTQVFKNVDIDDKSVVSALWGTYDASLGGIVGGKYGNCTLTFEDCDVACRLDAFNDACSNYQYYNYRLCGMLIGMTEEVTDGTATASFLTATNCTVTYDDWANYTYCEFEANGAGSYNGPGEWKFSRVQEGYATGGVDPTHTHDTDESHEELLVFDQLFGGDKGVKGGKTHNGVTVIYNNK